ncbi:MAG: hypothetical protein M3Y91_04325 [Actinomycetota bacterium]|nr:hypothetical protein [Actinomycetota bacterium]
MNAPPLCIVCVDCGETAHLLSVLGDEDDDRVAVYRCSGCWDRWDVVLEAETDDDTAAAGDDRVSLESEAARVGPAPVLREGETADSDDEGR